MQWRIVLQHVWELWVMVKKQSHWNMTIIITIYLCNFPIQRHTSSFLFSSTISRESNWRHFLRQLTWRHSARWLLGPLFSFAKIFSISPTECSVRRKMVRTRPWKFAEAILKCSKAYQNFLLQHFCMILRQSSSIETLIEILQHIDFEEFCSHKRASWKMKRRPSSCTRTVMFIFTQLFTEKLLSILYHFPLYIVFLFIHNFFKKGGFQ